MRHAIGGGCAVAGGDCSRGAASIAAVASTRPALPVTEREDEKMMEEKKEGTEEDEELPPPFPTVDRSAVLAQREPETWEREPIQSLPTDDSRRVPLSAT